jgi:hypothetical protein
VSGGFRAYAHHFAARGAALPPVDESLMVDYVVGSNGTLARSRRPGLEVGVPAGGHEVRGLDPVQPYVVWDFPKVPARMVDLMLAISRERCNARTMEALFYLTWSVQQPPADGEHSRVLTREDGWHLVYPKQRSTAESVEPVHTGAGSATERAIVEVHSHHSMPAEFSPDDDADELNWFRVYAILGTIFDRPQIRARVTLFGYAWEFPAAEFFELPEGVEDCVKP